MPLYRRVARRGFSNYPFKVTYEVVSLAKLNAAYEDGETVSVETLKEKGLVKGKDVQVKILNNGELTKKLTIEGIKVSATAAKAVENAGGLVK